MPDLGYVNINSSGRDGAPVTVNPATGSFGSSAAQTASASNNNGTSLTTNSSGQQQVTPTGSVIGSGPTKSYSIATSQPAQNDLDKITNTYNGIQQGVAGQITKNAANATVPQINGYNVSTTPMSGNGTLKFNVNGKTYYAQNQNPTNTNGPSADDVLKAISGSYGATNESVDNSTTPPTATSGGSTAPAVGSNATGTVNGGQPQPTTGKPADQAVANLQAETATNDTNLTNAYNDYKNSITAYQNGTLPLTPAQQSQITATNNAFDQIAKFQQTNAEFATGRYASFGQQISAMTAKLPQLELDRSLALSKMEEGFDSDNLKVITDSFDEFQKVSQQQQTNLDNISKTVIDQYNTDQQDYYNEVTKPIQDVANEAAKNGADPKTLAAINAAKNPTDAINASAGYLQTATGQLGDYLQYQRQTQQQGLTPMSYQDFQSKQDYEKSYSAEAGKTAADNALGVGTTSTDDGSSVVQGGITQATGLSVAAFNYLTQGTASMSRMPVAQRNQIMAEVNDYLNKTGTDISTFKTQYEANNTVLNNQIQRLANTKVFAQEAQGSADALTSVINNSDLKDIGNLKAADLAAIAAGKQINNPTAMKYSFQLQSMINDYAGYLAASRGSASPDDADSLAASQVVSSGLSAGSVDAFKSSIQSNLDKETGVIQNEVNSAQKSVWDLFGVGDKFQPKIDPVQSVNTYVAAHPDQAQNIANLYSQPGWSDQDVADYLNIAAPTSAMPSSTNVKTF